MEWREETHALLDGGKGLRINGQLSCSERTVDKQLKSRDRCVIEID